MSRNTKFGLVVALIAIATIGLIWGFLNSRKEGGEEEQGEKPVAASSRVTTANGVTVVTMKAEEQQRNGIRTAALELVSQKQEVLGTAVVLSIQDLITVRNDYIAANAQLEKARASLDVSQREYERLNGLYKDERNASAKAVQAAQGAMQADQVAVKAAADTVFLDQNNIRQQWGDVVSRWVFAHSPEFDRIVRQQDVLVQITLPPGMQTAAPSSASLRIAQGKVIKARLVSLFPRLDPRVQSPSFLYLAANQSGLIPGLNLAVLLPSGPLMQGVTVPANAVVWWEGNAWSYVQLSPTQFSRREVPTTFPVNQGWFVPTNENSALKPGDKLVVNGAQQMLSEEFRSEAQTVGESD